MCVGVGGLVWFVASEPFFFSFLLFHWKRQFNLLGYWYFNLNSYYFNFNFWFLVFFTIFYIFKNFKPALEITWFESLKFILRDVGGISSARHMIITIIIYLLVHLFSVHRLKILNFLYMDVFFFPLITMVRFSPMRMEMYSSIFSSSPILSL